MIRKWTPVLALLSLLSSLGAQEPLWMDAFQEVLFTDSGYLSSQTIFDGESIAEIRVIMNPDDYHRLIHDTQNNDYFQANMTYRGAAIPETFISEVGIRLRGKAVRNTDKKSFKISFSAFGHDDRTFQGLKKLNLNSDFQDPNLMRARLCTRLFRQMGVPAARTGYAKLYINDEYRGLFVNYEEIDKRFLRWRFSDNDGNLYKCPNNSTFLYMSGEDYARVPGWNAGEFAYELKTNEEENDFSDLAGFIDILNHTPQAQFPRAIEAVLNVDEVLMWLACNVLLGAWDDYWVLAKNFYFYHNPDDGRYSYIPHDFDGSLGTDWYHNDVADGNVYDWSPARGQRPLVEKLLAIPEYRRRYTHNLLLLCTWPFSLDALEPEVDRLADLIGNTLKADPFWPADWGWQAQDFEASLNGPIPRGNVKYGLKEYIARRRASALSQLEDEPPLIHFLQRSPQNPDVGETVAVSALVLDESGVTSVNMVWQGSISGTASMNDEGQNGDAVAGDGVFTGQIPGSGQGLVNVAILAEDISGQTNRFPDEGEWLSYSSGFVRSPVVINEFLAENDSVLADAAGEYDDWFELYNPTDLDVDLNGHYATDDLAAPGKWPLDGLTVPARGYRLIWADGDPDQGADHVDFKLSRQGEMLGVFQLDGENWQAVDTLRFGPQLADVSRGRDPDGSDTWTYFSAPTPGESNGGNEPTNSRVNLAPDGTAAADNSCNPAESAAHAIDGDTETKWCACDGIPHWLTVTLTHEARVDSFVIRHAGAGTAPAGDPGHSDNSSQNTRMFDIEVRQNGVWIPVVSVRDNPPTWEGDVSSHRLDAPVSGHEFRLYILDPGGDNAARIYEFEIYAARESSSISPPVQARELRAFTLHPNTPNPFNPETEVRFTLVSSGRVELGIYDMRGRRVRWLQRETLAAGDHSVTWDGKDEASRAVPSGVYVARLMTKAGIQSRKMVLIK